MLDLNQWKQGVQMHLPVFEAFLKESLQHPYALELKDNATGSDKEAKKQLQEADIIIRISEKNLNTELFFGFSQNWTKALANESSDGKKKNEGNNEERIIDLGSEWVEIISAAFKEAAMEIDIAQIDKIKKKELADSFNFENYFTSKIQLKTTGKTGDKESVPTLQMWIALSHLGKKDFEKIADNIKEPNPFTNGAYSEIANKIASSATNAQVSNSNKDDDKNITMEEKEIEFEEFSESKTAKNADNSHNIDLLKDVKMNVSVELGSRKMPLGEILQLVKGSVIELEKLAGDPVEILVNGHKIAQGEVVVIDEYFGVRISNLLAAQKQIKELQ